MRDRLNGRRTVRRPLRRGVWSNLLALLVIAAVVVAIVACEILNAELVYDDWMCAFAKCVKVKQ